MRIQQWALALAASVCLVAVGCAADDEMADEMSLGSADDAKSDTWYGSDADDAIARREWDEVYVDATSCERLGEVLSVSQNRLVYESEVLVVRPEPGQVVGIAPSAGSWLAELGGEMVLQAYFRRPGDTSWQPMSVSVTIDGRQGHLYVFNSLRFDGRDGWVTFVHSALAPRGHDVRFPDIRQTPVEYGFTVFPRSGWGDLEGPYEYVLNVTCDDGPCAAPEGVTSCSE